MNEAQVEEIALKMLDPLKSHPEKVGDSRAVDGYWIETHTLGCRREGGDKEDSFWEELWKYYDHYKNDGVSKVLGDPSDGAFVTITPQRQRDFVAWSSYEPMAPTPGRFSQALHQMARTADRYPSEVLDRMFDELNQKGFAGALERDFPITADLKSSRNLGLTYGVPLGRELGIDLGFKVTKVQLSNYYNLTDKQLSKVLAHEMIHVWQFQTNTRDKTHGKDFMRKKAQLEALGIEVSRGDTVDLELGYDGDKPKELKTIRALLIQPVTGPNFGAFNLSKLNFPPNLLMWKAAIGWRSSVKMMYLVDSAHPSLQLAGTKPKKHSVFPTGIGISPKALQEILETGNVLYQGSPEEIIKREAERYSDKKPQQAEA